MLARTTKFTEAAERGNAKPVYIVTVQKTVVFTEILTQADWEAGEQEGTASTTTLNGAISDSATSVTVDDTSDFSWPDSSVAAGQVLGYLILTDGTDLEIVSYNETDPFDFKGLTRGQFGTTALAWDDADDVIQLEFDPAVGTSFDLGIQKRHWRQPIVTGSVPGKRDGLSLVYNSSNNTYLLFGGELSSSFFNDVWEFDPSSNTWSEFTSATGTPPAARSEHMSVWDSNRDVMIVHGGQVGPTTADDFADTFEFDPAAGGGNGAWTQTDTAPVARFRAARAWDSVNNVMHIASGVGGGNFPTFLRPDAWEYDGTLSPGTQWTQTSTETGPFAPNAFGTSEMIGSKLVFLALVSTAKAVIYDTASGTWSEGASRNIDSDNAFTVDPNTQKMITPGQASDQTEIYDVQTNSWSRSTDTPTQASRREGGGTWNTTNNEAFFWGGTSSDEDPIIFQWLHQSMQWRSDVMDLGEIPTSDGVAFISSTVPLTGDTDVVLTLEHSTDGISFTDFDSGNPVSSGQVLDVQERFWRSTLVLTSNIDDTPRVQRVRLSFGETFTACMADNPVLGLPPIVKNIPNLSSKLDPLKQTASISEIKIEVLNQSQELASIIKENSIYNNTISILLGFDEPGFEAVDFLPFNSGVVNDWEIDRGVIIIKARDNLDALKDEIPEASGTSLPTSIPYNTGTVSHPIAIQTDILQNQININDEDLDLDSFTSCENDPALAGWNFNRTLTEPAPGKKYLEEISRLTGAPIIPSEDGRLRCKLYDSSEEPVATWDERHILKDSVKFKLLSKEAKNFIPVYFDGDGDSASDYNNVDVQSDADSIARWNRTIVEKIFSRWLGASGSPYDGEVRAADIGARILERYKDSAPETTLETGLDWYHLQVGDLVFISGVDDEYTIPYLSLNFDFVRGLKFQIVQKTVQAGASKVKWILRRAPQVQSVDVDSQTDWETGGDNFEPLALINIDTTTTAGSIQLDATGITAGEGSYELRISLDQQPERDFTIDVDFTEPANTAVLLNIAGSHTGEFTGEEILLVKGLTPPATPTVVTTEKFRFYCILFILTNTDGTSTPLVNQFEATFPG